MATPDRDNLYTTTGEDRTVYSRESNGTGWFVGIIVALALIAIGYLVFAANTGPATTTPAVDGTAPMTAPADPAMAPATDAVPMTDAAPVTETTVVETAPAADAPAPVEAPVQ